MDIPEEQRIYIPIDEKTGRGLERLSGASVIHEALAAVPERDRTAGFRLASAIVDREVAELRIQHAQNALRAAAKHGVNMAEMNLMIGYEEGKVVLFAAPMDLVDRAE